MGDSSARDMTVIEKKEVEREGSTSPSNSTPDPDPETYAQENTQTQKRKGGRKPIYATSEERKQRNRQAQAAFRERRTEYIKQLESTIKHHEETLQSLQQSHRSAADECLMLRYKNSLLERILLEKGIDVQAELQAKTGSPNIGPVRGPPSANTSPAQGPMRSAIMNRHQQARRSLVGITQKGESVQSLPLSQPDGLYADRSPGLQPTPNSTATSPATGATRSPNFLPQQGGTSSPNFAPLAQQPPPPHLRSPQQHRTSFGQIQAAQRPSLMTSHTNSSGMSSGPATNSSGASAPPHTYYPSPFQSHADQLDQEYDAQADMYDEQESNEMSAGPGAYPNPFPPQQDPQQHNIPPSMQTGSHNPMQAQQLQHLHQQQQQRQPRHLQQSPVSLQSADGGAGPNMFGPMNQLFDPYDPMLDADPFGLSASMHFPTQFTYESR